MQWLYKIAIMLPIFALLSFFSLKFMFQQMVRKEVIGSQVHKLDEGELRSLYSTSKLLCVGCTSGIGAGIALEVCNLGGNVVVIGRSTPNNLFEKCTEGQVEFIAADLSSMKTVKRISQRMHAYAFDTVLFTVGIVTGKEKRVSSEGIEMDTAVSFLSRFVMARDLARSDTLHSTLSRKARIFIMGFPGAEEAPQMEDFNWETIPFQPWTAHKNTVIGNDALVLHIADKYSDSINIYGLSPGIIRTHIMADFLGGRDSLLAQVQQLVIGIVCPSVTQYVQGTLRHLLLSPDIEDINGASFNQMGERILPSAWVLDSANVRKFVLEGERLETIALSS